MPNEIKIESGEKREFSTGAKSQASSGKGTSVLVPGDAIIDIAKLFEKGAILYSARNWEKGIPLSEILNSLERHLQQEKMGQTDENHARALAWRAMIYLATKLRIEKGLLPAELDDMPTYPLSEKRQEEKPVDTMKSMAHNDGQWYCSESDCCERGFSNVAPNTFYCDKHKHPIPKSSEISSSKITNMKWYCSGAGCLKQGKANRGAKTYYCPKHEYMVP